MLQLGMENVYVVYKYRLINSVRHLSVPHTILLLTVLLSWYRTEDMVLLGKVSMHVFVLAVSANSCKM